MSEVRHNDKTGEFYIETDGGRATLNYLREGDALNFHHTFVPEALRGKGIAQKVVAAGFDYARKNKLKIIPTCPYVQRLMAKNPELKDLVKGS